MVRAEPKRDKLEDQLQNFVDQGLTSTQMAIELKMSRTWVLDTLKKYGITLPKKNRLTNPKNYRHHTPPFGYKKLGNELVHNSSQMITCHIIARARKIDKLSFSEIARQLSRNQVPNAKGTTYWDHKAVKKIFEHWKDKF